MLNRNLAAVPFPLKHYNVGEDVQSCNDTSVASHSRYLPHFSRTRFPVLSPDTALDHCAIEQESFVKLTGEPMLRSSLMLPSSVREVECGRTD